MKRHVLFLLLLGAYFTNKAQNFPDISGNWAELEINYLADNNFISGFPDGTFKPFNRVTRAEFATMIVKSLNVTPISAYSNRNFSDINGHWAKNNILKAARAGFIAGFPDGTFKPNATLTRVQMIAALSNTGATFKADLRILSRLQDEDDIPNWAKQTVANALLTELVVNYPNVNQFRPNDLATRADVAATIYLLRKKYIPESGYVRNKFLFDAVDGEVCKVSNVLPDGFVEGCNTCMANCGGDCGADVQITASRDNWDSNKKFDFTTFFTYKNINPARVSWAIKDKTTKEIYTIENPQNFYFNKDGMDTWGNVEMRAYFTCFDNEGTVTFQSRKFEIEVLDYGLYFMGKDGSVEKYFVPSIDQNGNAYHDDSKPTVIYVHGYNFKSASKHSREKIAGRNNDFLAKKWIDFGYNVAVFYWNQFADDNLLQAQGKIYGTNLPLAWRKEKDNVIVAVKPNESSPNVSVADLFEGFYSDLWVNSSNRNFRIAGHSLGSQLTVRTTELLGNIAPRRIAMLDPWFSNSERIGNTMQKVIDRGTTIEWYQSSYLLDITKSIKGAPALSLANHNHNEQQWNKFWEEFADESSQWGVYNKIPEDIVYVSMNTQFADNWVRIDPLQIPDPVDLHRAAVQYYFNSIDEGFVPNVQVPIFSQANGNDTDVDGDERVSYVYAQNPPQPQFAPTAALPDDMLRDLKGRRFWQAAGSKSLTSYDDLFAFAEHENIMADFETSSPETELNYNLLMGNPSNATRNPENSTNYLVSKDEYVLSYNAPYSRPNWVSWHLDQGWLGELKRPSPEPFREDPTLPSSYYKVKYESYTKSGFTRGHMCPSSHRTKTETMIKNTYFMTNMVPQNSYNNNQTWEKMEDALLDWVKNKGWELYIVAGGDGVGTTLGNKRYEYIDNEKIAIPSHLWVVVLALPRGTNDLSRVTGNHPAFAVWMPNVRTSNIESGKENRDPWDLYATLSVRELERKLNYNFFKNLPQVIQNQIEVRTYEEVRDMISDGANSARTLTSPLETSNQFSVSSTNANLTVYPMPFGEQTNIQYTLTKPGNVSVQLFDGQGRSVRVFQNKVEEAGIYSFTWDGTNTQHQKLPKGLYYLMYSVDGKLMKKQRVLH